MHASAARSRTARARTPARFMSTSIDAIRKRQCSRSGLAQAGEPREEVALLGRQVRGQSDSQAGEQVAMRGGAAELRHAAALESERLSWLAAGRNAEHDVAGEGGNLD